MAFNKQVPRGPSFNLAIEMLVSSGSMISFAMVAYVTFQSRNREACQFRIEYQDLKWEVDAFQSRNRDACQFREKRAFFPVYEYEVFQSRNRDAFHFRLQRKLRGEDSQILVSIS